MSPNTNKKVVIVFIFTRKFSSSDGAPHSQGNPWSFAVWCIWQTYKCTEVTKATGLCVTDIKNEDLYCHVYYSVNFKLRICTLYINIYSDIVDVFRCCSSQSSSLRWFLMQLSRVSSSRNKSIFKNTLSAWKLYWVFFPAVSDWHTFLQLFLKVFFAVFWMQTNIPIWNFIVKELVGISYSDNEWL